MTKSDGGVELFTGTIRSVSLVAATQGQILGDERWEISLHPDGLRALRARCLIHDDPPVLRDVLQSVDREFHPHDGFTRITVSGAFRGSAWYRFTDTEAECEAYTVGEGRVSQRYPIKRGIRGFGTHSLQSDGWLAAGYDLSRGPGTQRFFGNLMTTTNHRGATGPMFMTTDSSLEYVGIEEIQVPAGEFHCHHFRFVGTSHGYPPYDMWVTADGHYFFVAASLGGSRAQRFELTSFNHRPELGV